MLGGGTHRPQAITLPQAKSGHKFIRFGFCDGIPHLPSIYSLHNLVYNSIIYKNCRHKYSRFIDIYLNKQKLNHQIHRIVELNIFISIDQLDRKDPVSYEQIFYLQSTTRRCILSSGTLHMMDMIPVNMISLLFLLKILNSKKQACLV